MRIDGLAYDSLAKQALSGAFVSIAGVGRSATSDDKGRFRIDSVPVGTHVFSMQHAAFDSLGLSGVSVRVAVQNGMPRVTLAVPSFATLWRAACGDVPAPKDSALVFGSVRDASTNETAANANVELSWVDLVGGGKSLAQVGQRKWKRTATTDDRGEFALCGIPANTLLTLVASIDSLAVSTVEIPATLARVQRREVLVARRVVAPAIADVRTSTDSASTVANAVGSPTGVVTGTVTSEDGKPIANAVVTVDTLAEVRSGEDGRFSIQSVPAGTRQISVVSIGKQPFSSTFNLLAGDTARMLVPLVSVQLLGEVKVKSTMTSIRIRNYEERKRQTTGAFRDSSEIRKYPTLTSTLLTVPGAAAMSGNLEKLTFGMGPQACSAQYGQVDWRLDGHPTSATVVQMLDPKTIATMEIYTRRSKLPAELVTAIGYRCAVLVWTKQGFGR